jgi:hypothetical protein
LCAAQSNRDILEQSYPYDRWNCAARRKQTHFIAKRPAIHENDAFLAIFAHSKPQARAQDRDCKPLQAIISGSVRNTVFRSLNEREKPHLKYWSFGFFLFFGLMKY